MPSLPIPTGNVGIMGKQCEYCGQESNNRVGSSAQISQHFVLSKISDNVHVLLLSQFHRTNQQLKFFAERIAKPPAP
jgi:hypothetical protein